MILCSFVLKEHFMESRYEHFTEVVFHFFVEIIVKYRGMVYIQFMLDDFCVYHYVIYLG